MKSYLKSILFVSTVLTASAASADVYRGFYQFKNSQGQVIYQSALKLTTKAISSTKHEYIYEEVTQKGLAKTVCDVTIKSLANGRRSITENCSSYSNVLECDGNLCAGISEWPVATAQDIPMAARESSVDKTSVYNLLSPIEYRGLKDVKTINQILKIESPAK